MTRQLSSFQTIHISSGSFISKQTMQKHICLVMIAVYACNANINITGGDTFYFDYMEKLSITCTNNEDAIVEFRKKGSQLTTCVPSNPCSVSDVRFNVTHSTASSEWQFLLETVGNFTTDLCGSYECVNVQNGQSDTVKVSLKDFDSSSYFAEEKEDELLVSTACAFPAIPEITWYTFYNNSLQPMSDEDLDEFSSFNRSTLCSNVTCDTLHAQSLTFGLDFSVISGNRSLSYVEIKIVHPMFRDKPLVWRSSKKYPVLGPSATDQQGGDTLIIIILKVAGGVGGGGGGVVVVVFVVAKKISKERKKKKLINKLPLFESFSQKEKSSIADAMYLIHIGVKGTDRKPVTIQGNFSVIVGGELHIPEFRNNEEADHRAKENVLEEIGGRKPFGIGCAFVNDSQQHMKLTLAVDVEYPTSKEMAEDKKIPEFRNIEEADHGAKENVLEESFISMDEAIKSVPIHRLASDTILVDSPISKKKSRKSVKMHRCASDTNIADSPISMKKSIQIVKMHRCASDTNILDSPILMKESRKSVKMHRLASDAKIVIKKDVKLLVMSSANYENSLMKYDKWKAILNGRVPPKHSKDPEEGNRKQTKVDDADDKQLLIIIEASAPEPSTSETKHESKQDITTEKGHPDLTGKLLQEGIQVPPELRVDKKRPDVYKKSDRNLRRVGCSTNEQNKG